MRFYHDRLRSLPAGTADLTRQFLRGRHAARFDRLAKRLVAQIDSAAALFAAAEALARDVEIDRAALDYLYARRSSSALSRADWEAAVCVATAVPFMLRSPPKGFPWARLVEPQAIDAAFDELARAPNAARGTLLLSFHSTFSKIGVRLFSRRRDDGVTLGTGQIRKDSHGQLFAGLDALRDGRMVLVAPDGGSGRQTAHVDVLGAAAPVGDGAAFLGHTTRCNVAWYTIMRQDDRLVPVVAPGLAAQEGETLAAFTERLHAFYRTQIEACFTGDPRNIVLMGRWARCFAAAARQPR